MEIGAKTCCLKWWLIGMVIAVDSALPSNPAVGLDKVFSQLRPVVVKFVHCYLFYNQSFWDHCVVVVPCTLFETWNIDSCNKRVGKSLLESTMTQCSISNAVISHLL